MSRHPSEARIEPALAADLVAAAAAFGAAIWGVGAWAALIGALFALVAATRAWRSRSPTFGVNGATLTIGDRALPIADCAVGPRVNGVFYLYELGDRLVEHEVREDRVVRAAVLHAAIVEQGRSVDVFRAGEVHQTLRRQVLPLCFALLAGAALLHQYSADERTWGMLVSFGVGCVALSMFDALMPRGAPLVIDTLGARVHWNRWIPADRVRVGTPRISRLDALDLPLDLDGAGLTIGRWWGPSAEIRAALAKVPGVRLDET